MLRPISRWITSISVGTLLSLLDRVLAQLPCFSVALFYLSLRHCVCSNLHIPLLERLSGSCAWVRRVVSKRALLMDRVNFRGVQSRRIE